MVELVFEVISMVIFEFERMSVGWLLDLQELSVRTIEHIALIVLHEYCELVREGAILGCLLSDGYYYDT